jgi:Flp pilus assembly protein TadD
MRSRLWTWGAVIAVLIVLGVVVLEVLPSRNAATTRAAQVARAGFVGGESCAGCHAREHRAWQASQHSRAMQHANDKTVLGDFEDARFSYAGVQTTFFRRDGAYFVRTDGADGKMAEFEIKYTFGVEPLQQYLIELPGRRLQALSIAWDARPASAGGGRWFHLYPGEHIDSGDELHWTKRQQNWNFMCADCHSVDVRKNFDAAKDAYATSWSDLSVGCEGCHGPGSAHVAWAKQPDPSVAHKGLTVALDERRDVRWSIDPVSGNATRSRARTTDREIEVCAQCHARRGQIAEDYVAGRPFLDHYMPALLTDPLYYADGQQRGEVYVWASFLQSRMYRHGVTCSDCHDPHTQKTRAQGDAVCAQCHSAAKYAATTHHHHEPASPGARCVSCHMPTTTYMGVDARRDHSFRIPRPERTVALGVPNACSGCHSKQDAKWAEQVVLGWYGHVPAGFQAFAPAFSAAQKNAPGAAASLAQVASDISQSPVARASAIERLAQLSDSATLMSAARRGVGDAHPLVRLAAIRLLEALPAGDRLPIGAPLLSDPMRAIRIEAARVLAPAIPGASNMAQHAAWRTASEEFVAAQRYNADRPESMVVLGSFEAALRQFDDAQAAFAAARALDPAFVPAYVNAAEALRVSGREADAEAMLRDGVQKVPRDAALHHALGLALARRKEPAGAMRELDLAARLAQDEPRYVYVYAVALNSYGRSRDAVRVLERAIERFPRQRDMLVALVTFHRDAGNRAAARAMATRLVEAFPDDAEAKSLLQSVE